jgi:predicted TIM-barrel fold metal-dependent hydrolase
MIIDIHGHIGDILYPGGGALIFREGIAFPASSGLQRPYEKALFRESLVMRIVNKAFPMISVNGERRRNFAATLENFRKSLEGTGITQCVCAPVAPFNTYEDILAARDQDQRIIAFTSPDFTREDAADRLANDLPGAAGVKIHPILQGVEADSKQVMETIEVTAAYARPVLLHAGKARYYPAREGKDRFTGCAATNKIERLIQAFPSVNFIVGHAGLDEVRSVLDRLPTYKNAYVDTSFQPPEAIRALILAFGGGRVLLGSDWPYGLRLPAVRAAEEACRGDAALLRAVLWENAAGLLNWDC